MVPWDLFISHASEDKATFVDPLAHRLKELAVRVWYDRFVLKAGDRLSERIAEGLAKSRCGLIVISPSFLGKPWTAYELSGLINRFVEENTRLIPIWLGVTRTDVASFNPVLADLLAVKGNVTEINACAMEILRVVRPQLYENFKLMGEIDSATIRVERKAKTDLKSGPIRHHDLPESLLVRIQNIWFALRDILPISLEKSIENFQRDLRPEHEVVVWERIVTAYHTAMDMLKTDELDKRKQTFKILLSFSVGNHGSVFEDTDAGIIDQAITDAAAKAWLKAAPAVTVHDVDTDRK